MAFGINSSQVYPSYLFCSGARFDVIQLKSISMATRIAQFIYNMKLKQSTSSFIDRLKLRLIDVLFDIYKKRNPLIETNIGLFKLQLPFSHQLPFILKSSPHYSTNLARIAKHVCGKYNDLRVIDVGANVGDSVALLRTEAMFSILCIEGDDYFFSILEANMVKFSDVHLAKTYVGESTEELNVASFELGGTAHLGHMESGGIPIQLKKISTILKDNPLFKKAKMLKIDTDGFDNKILRGSVDFLEDSKPIIFFEYDPFFLSQQNEDGLSIFNVIAKFGYRKLLIYENYGEFLVSVDIANSNLLEDINHFYTGRKGLLYCDICAFHEEDNDLFDLIRKSELRFFEKMRS